MTNERKITIALGGALLLFLALICALAWQQHKATDEAAQTKAVDDAEKRMLQSQIDDRDAEDLIQQKKSAIAQAAVKTSSDAARVIIQTVAVPVAANAAPAQVALPQTVAVTPQQVSDDVRKEMPESPSYIIQTQDAAVATARNLQQCRADQSSLSTCQQDKLDLQAQLVAEEKSAQAWKQAAQGGSVAKRFLQVAKCAGFAGGGAVAGQYIAGGRGAAIGGAAGAVACHFVF